MNPRHITSGNDLPSFSSRSLSYDISFCPLKQEFLRRDLARHEERAARDFCAVLPGKRLNRTVKAARRKGGRGANNGAEERARSIDTRLPFDSLPVDKRRAADAAVVVTVGLTQR